MATIGERARRRAAFARMAGGLVAATAALCAIAQAPWSAPPRYDGAGYAVLGRALLEGRGYRSIDHPDRPRHVHFPPGYPTLLAATWRLTGVSTIAARIVSVACTAGAALAAWCWFRRMMPPRPALFLGLALAVNWLWGRTGGSIQSEPPYLLLGQATILVASRTGRGPAARARWLDPARLGVLLAAALLTRHVAIGLELAVLIDLALRRRWREALAVLAISGALISPWLARMATAGAEGRTQAGLLIGGKAAGIRPVAERAAFYVRRIPDQVTGPFVEVATVFGRSRAVARAAGAWAVAATAVIAMGWLRALRWPRRRLAGLVPLCTLLILIPWPYTEAGRFLIPLIPFILVGAAEGIAAILGRLPRRRGSAGMTAARRRSIAAALVLAASLPYSAYAIMTGRARATEAAQRDFDAACAWLAGHADRPGPVLTRHPGEVFWQTGRPSLEVPTSERPGDLDAEAIARTIDAYRVAYLLVDRERYANAVASPLARFVARHPGRVREVWGPESDRSAVTVYEVEPARPTADLTRPIRSLFQEAAPSADPGPFRMPGPPRSGDDIGLDPVRSPVGGGSVRRSGSTSASDGPPGRGTEHPPGGRGRFRL